MGLVEINLRYLLPKQMIKEIIFNDFKLNIIQNIDRYSDKKLKAILKERCS